MPPKRTVLPMLSWAKKGGQLTTHARGIVFGMHIAGMSALAIADRMGMTPNGVRHSIAISETIVHGGRDETIPSAPTTPSPKKKEIAKRRRRVDALLRKRGRDGNPVIGSARDMQRALLEEGVEVDRSTVTRDMVATGARFLARPTTADLTEAHKQTRVELGRDLLQVDPNVIIFTDESLFDCSDPMSHEWVVKGEKPRPRPVAKWTAKVHVWGAIGVGVKRLVVLRSDRVTSESYGNRMFPCWRHSLEH